METSTSGERREGQPPATQEDDSGGCLKCKDLLDKLDGCLRRLNIVRESDGAVIDDIDRLNFQVSELQSRLDKITEALHRYRTTPGTPEPLAFRMLTEAIEAVAVETHDHYAAAPLTGPSSRLHDDLAEVHQNRELPASERQEPDLAECPGCGGPADNGHDRCLPPNPYYCSKCCASEGLEIRVISSESASERQEKKPCNAVHDMGFRCKRPAGHEGPHEGGVCWQDYPSERHAMDQPCRRCNSYGHVEPDCPVVMVRPTDSDIHGTKE